METRTLNYGKIAMVVSTISLIVALAACYYAKKASEVFSAEKIAEVVTQVIGGDSSSHEKIEKAVSDVIRQIPDLVSKAVKN